jgi:hypothetical protein
MSCITFVRLSSATFVVVVSSVVGGVASSTSSLRGLSVGLARCSSCCCCCCSCCCCCCGSRCCSSGIASSDGGTGLAMPAPGCRIGNSSSRFAAAFAEPGFRIGNSSSSNPVGIGIGAEMVPRIDLLRPGLARLAAPDFQRLGMAFELAYCRKATGDYGKVAKGKRTSIRMKRRG